MACLNLEGRAAAGNLNSHGHESAHGVAKTNSSKANKPGSDGANLTDAYCYSAYGAYGFNPIGEGLPKNQQSKLFAADEKFLRLLDSRFSGDEYNLGLLAYRQDPAQIIRANSPIRDSYDGKKKVPNPPGVNEMMAGKFEPYGFGLGPVLKPAKDQGEGKKMSPLPYETSVSEHKE